MDERILLVIGLYNYNILRGREWSRAGVEGGSSQGVNRSTETIDRVTRGIDKPNFVSAEAEEAFYAFSDRLSTVAKVVLRVTVVARSRTTAGATLVVIGHRV